MSLLNPVRSKSHEIEIQGSNTFIPVSWLNTYLGDFNANDKKLLELYLSVPELQAIINYKARVFAGMQIKAKNEAGEEKQIPLLNLFAQPNPFQNFKEFSQQYYILRGVFGNDFIHPVFGFDKKQSKALYNMPPVNATAIPSDEKVMAFEWTKKEELIKGYKFEFMGQELTYEADEIIHYNDNQIKFDEDSFLLGDSKIRPLVQACENIKSAYEARGILIQNSALGILSNETTDSDGTVPMLPKEKEQIHEDYKKYGMVKGKYQFIITNAALKWQSMDVEPAKMGLFEETKEDFKTIANAYNFPHEVLQSGTAYENKEKAIKQLYQEAIQPEADEFLQGISNFMGLEGITLVSDFSHIAILQADLRERSVAMNQSASALDKALKGGFIDSTEAEEQFKKFLI